MITRTKTLISLTACTIILSMTGCAQKQEEFNDYSLFEDESKNDEAGSIVPNDPFITVMYK
ncbi:MAG: hypothetical protein J6W58_07910 [Lachnospiraceae bacterium]|nr:hypothetical protein [Lachnospiraceae bacterium]MBP5414842.1 hypothetical protein [Lachnospiraceae bacterium]MBP5746206.1 hypothetical protein [Lachnospiraceae bacterium]